MQAASSSTVHKLLTKYAEAAGEGGLVRMVVAGDTKLICTTPAAFAAVLRGTGFLPRPGSLYNVFFMFGIKAHSILTTPDGTEHARVRKHMMKFFNADNIALTIGRLEAQMLAAIGSITSAVSETPAEPTGAPATGGAGLDMGVCNDEVTEEGVLVDTYKFTSYNVLRVVFEVFLEVDVVPPIDALNSAFGQANNVSSHPAQYALLKRGLYVGHRRYRRNYDALYKFHKELVSQIYAKPPPGDSTSLWATIRNAFPDALTDKDEFEAVIANISFTYAAGYETTANAVRHTLAALAIDQESQEALAEELRDAGLLATPDVPAPPAITAEQLAGLSVLDAVCHEGLRIFPPAPIGGLRLLTKDTEISGYTVPKGTVVMCPVWALHHNRHVWGEDALLWRPDRWLQGASVAAAKKAPDGNPRFLPFLDGVSNCIGQHLALVEMKVMVAAVVSRLHISLDARMGDLRSVEDYFATLATRLSLQTTAPTWLRMRPRTAHA